MGLHSPASTPRIETWESDSEDEHEFGYPLQRMVPLESVELGHEEPESPPRGLLRGLYNLKMPVSVSSSTSSHIHFV
jgi:hypothetical protein